MFAYCLNNPINRIDASGDVSIWYYLIVDHDMGFIHRLVQAHIALNYGVKTEVTLSAYGRADILNYGAIWEIKHAGVLPEMRVAEAYSQAFNYVLLNKEVTHLGPAGTYCGSFYIGCDGYSYFVKYTTPADGVVLYTVTEVTNYNGVYDYAYYPVKARKKKTQIATSIAILGLGAASGVAFGYDAGFHNDFSYAYN